MSATSEMPDSTDFRAHVLDTLEEIAADLDDHWTILEALVEDMADVYATSMQRRRFRWRRLRFKLRGGTA